MPYEITVDHDRELIEIHVMGETNLLEAQEARNRAALISAEMNFRKVAVYGEQLEKVQGFSPAMIFNFAISFRDKPFPKGTKFAVLTARVSGGIRTLVRIACENGTRMKIFEDDRIALDWLDGALATAELEAI